MSTSIFRMVLIIAFAGLLFSDSEPFLPKAKAHILKPHGSEAPSQTIGIPAKKAADYIHAVIEANRTLYSKQVVEHLEEMNIVKATENWAQENTLPLPAQFLLLSSQISKKKRLGMSYRLMSLWPVNKKNGPRSAFEKVGLEEVIKNPEEPYTEIVSLSNELFFQAVYADKAEAKVCVTCHNGHPNSPKNDFKLGSVMGGIYISFPLGKEDQEIDKTEHLLAPEVVADYIHSILESDRTVYSEYIVNRLQDKNITYATEFWYEENALMLPAQFVKNATALIHKVRKKLGLDLKLISLWPVNRHSGPANKFERMGLEYVVRNPFRPFIGFKELGGKQYFQAVYPDFAVSKACVDCHNAHPLSPKRDFKLNDVMGGIVVTLWLD